MTGDELQVIRYFRIDEEIRAGNKPNAKKLAKILNITERSVHRYISEMRYEMRAPIEVAGRTGGYYYTDPNFSISSLSLNENEYLTLVMAQHLFYALFGPQFSMLKTGEGFNSLINRASKAVKEKQIDIQDCIQIALPMMGYTDAVNIIITSMNEKRPVLLSTDTNSFAARALRIVFAFDRWYLLYIIGQPTQPKDFLLEPLSTFIKAELFPEGKAVGIPVSYQNAKSYYKYIDNLNDSAIEYAHLQKNGKINYSQAISFRFETKDEKITLQYRRLQNGSCEIINGCGNDNMIVHKDPELDSFLDLVFGKDANIKNSK